MEIIKKPAPFDPAKYAASNTNPETKYGLPQEVIYCKVCTNSNQRPNSAPEYLHNKNTKKATLGIGADGVCDACTNSARKDVAIDWSTREKELMALCDKYRRTDGHYDCLVPGSGGKDSFYTAHVLKYKYGMNPLTVTWAPHIYTNWGWRNLQAWIHAGFDNYLFTPNGRVHRLLTRLAVETIFHPFQPFMLGQMYYAPKMAEKLNIPLVFYGENAAEYGNPIKENESAKKDFSYFTATDKSKIFLAGVSVSDLMKDFGLNQTDLDAYLPADPNLLEKKKIEVHYLGYYLKWHPQSNYYYAVENGGFEAAPERSPGSYSKYSGIDDKVDDFHFFTTHIKFGLGRATYDTCQEIRNREITREEGVLLVKRFDGEYPERFSDDVMKYLSLPEKEFPVASKMFEQPVIDKNYFLKLSDTYRPAHLWKFENGQWSLRHPITHLEAAASAPVSSLKDQPALEIR